MVQEFDWIAFKGEDANTFTGQVGLVVARSEVHRQAAPSLLFLGGKFYFLKN